MEPRIIENHHFQDERGHFVKAFDGIKEADFKIAQSNCVTSHDKGTLRGLHMQDMPFSEAKIFTVVRGSIQLVCAYMGQSNSPKHKTYSFEIDNTSTSLMVPKGYATGYLTLEDDTTVLYFSDELYKPESERGVRWDDPSLNINWKIEPLFVSEKDKQWPSL